ncbi:VOC family protein [Companilactobacillus hulinensis]|uniref:VOC family protein n=1 Tax=Companilactobacillus hulinensis TaxID=2486007 RepID=UPI000F771961|nr:VOC family protein [Companilactobacillus hulinensis]
MLQKLEVMLYVRNVDLIAKFFEDALGATLIKETKMIDGSFEIKLSVLDQVNINLYDVEFIREYSPSVSLEMPSMMFLTNDVRDLHDQIEMYANTISEVSAQGDQLVFNFSDPEDHYYAVGSITE